LGTTGGRDVSAVKNRLKIYSPAITAVADRPELGKKAGRLIVESLHLYNAPNE
jgi:hypothetical protein